VAGWEEMHKRFGRLPWKDLFRPAIYYAENGFPVTDLIQWDWDNSASKLGANEYAKRVFLPQGQAPKIGEVFRNPDLARTFAILRTQGRDGFYNGEIGAGLLAKSRALGGVFEQADLDGTRADWVSPISTNYHGYDVYEFPPSTQGFAVLQMLNILEACAPWLGVDLKALGPRSPLYWHLLVEAKKLAYADLHAFNADPQFEQVPLA